MSILSQITWLKRMYNYLYSKIGGGVVTSNSSSVTFTGTGTEDDPLTAEASGGGSYTFSNGIQENGGDIKLGLELAPPYTNGVLTEDLYLIKGSVLSENFKGLVVSDVDITGITTIVPIESAPNTGSTLRSGVSGTGVTSDVTVFYDRVDVGTSVSTEYYKGMVYKSDYSSNYTDRSLVDKGYVDARLGSNTNVVTTSTNLNLVPGSYYRYNGTQAATFTLPPLTEGVGNRIGILNGTEFDITLNSNAGGNDIFDSGMSSNTITIFAGTARIIYNSELEWFFLT